MLDYCKPELLVLGTAPTLIKGVKTPPGCEPTGFPWVHADSELDD